MSKVLIFLPRFTIFPHFFSVWFLVMGDWDCPMSSSVKPTFLGLTTFRRPAMAICFGDPKMLGWTVEPCWSRGILGGSDNSWYSDEMWWVLNMSWPNYWRGTWDTHDTRNKKRSRRIEATRNVKHWELCGDKCPSILNHHVRHNFGTSTNSKNSWFE